MTFRLNDQIANKLRQIPNQTAFVEKVLAEALGETCPNCRGTGRIPASAIEVSNFKANDLPRLDRESAVRLRQLIVMAKAISATHVDISFVETRFQFTVRKDSSPLLEVFA